MVTGTVLGIGCVVACFIGVAYLMFTAPAMPPDDLPEPQKPVYADDLESEIQLIDGRFNAIESRMGFVGQLADKVVGALERLAKLEERLAALEASQGRSDRARAECAKRLAEAALALEGLEQSQ